jgi:O-antigen/teichoic acid export membrane protein
MRSSLIKSVGAQASGALFCAAISFALTLWLGRQLGTAAFGHYIWALNLATLALVLQEGGWPARLYQQWTLNSPHPEQNHPLMARALAHVLWVTVALCALLGLWAWQAWPQPSAQGSGHAATLAMAILCMGAVAITNTVSARLRGTGRFAREALWQSAARIASALAVLAVLVLVAVSPFWVFVGWAAGLALLLVWTAPRWWIRPQFKGLSADYPQLWPFVLMALASIWLLKGDIVLLGWLQVPAEDLSLYAACTRLTEAALLIFAPLGNVLLRSFGQLPNESARRALLHRLLWLVTVAGLLACGLALWQGPWLMQLLFGFAFEPAGHLLPWVLTLLPLALGIGVMTPYLMARQQERPLALLMALAGALLTVAAPWTSTHWGLQGMALTITLAQAIVWLGALALCHKPDKQG